MYWSFPPLTKNGEKGTGSWSGTIYQITMVLKSAKSAPPAAVWQAASMPSLMAWLFGSVPTRQVTVGAIFRDCRDWYLIQLWTEDGGWRYTNPDRDPLWITFASLSMIGTLIVHSEQKFQEAALDIALVGFSRHLRYVGGRSSGWAPMVPSA